METTKKVSGESRSKIRLHLPKIQGSLGPLERNESTYTAWMRFILSIFICQWICQSIDWVCETNWPKVTAPELPYLSAWPPFHSKEKLQSRVLEFIPCRTAWRWCRVEHAHESTHTTHWKKKQETTQEWWMQVQVHRFRDTNRVWQRRGQARCKPVGWHTSQRCSSELGQAAR